MTPQQISEEVARLSWYHEINLGYGIVTPGQQCFRPIWQMIRRVRSKLNYENATVLDIGAYDGLFSFEAEQLKAKLVVATDCCYRPYANFLLCQKVLNSKVIPYYNVSPYNLEERLDVFLQESFSEEEPPYSRLFDVVQHLGLLYHLRDPIMSLAQARSCMKTGGYLIIETAAVEGTDSEMVFNGVPEKNEVWGTCGEMRRNYHVSTKPKARFGPDASFFWCPTPVCLMELLRATLFEPLEDTFVSEPAAPSVGYRPIRLCGIAKAVKYGSVESHYAEELKRTYRNPGLHIHD